MYIPDCIYSTVHLWLKNEYGKADKCEAPDCDGQSEKYEWSRWNSKPCVKKRENFRMLCVPCHRKYDLLNSPSPVEKQISKVFYHLRIDLFMDREEFSKFISMNLDDYIELEECRKLPSIEMLKFIKKTHEEKKKSYDDFVFRQHFKYLDYLERTKEP